MIRRRFILAAAGAATLSFPARAADTLSGKYAGNGKEAKMAFISAWTREPFSGKDAIQIVMTERDHSASKRPDWDADFGKFGSALTISMFRADGRIFGCQVAHDALKRKPVSVLGTIKTLDFKLAGERVEGRFSSGGVDKLFDETYEIDLTFAADIRKKAA